MNKNLFKKQNSLVEGRVWFPSIWVTGPRSTMFRDWGQKKCSSLEKENNMCDGCGCGSVDKLLKLAVETKLRSFVEAEIPFSAWDITSQIRDSVGPTYDVSHKDVRDIVNDWFENDAPKIDWCRTLVVLQNDKITYVYHPLTVNAEAYPTFAELATTMGSSVTEEEQEESEVEERDFENAYNRLMNVFESLEDAVLEFTDGNITINQLKDESNRCSSRLSDIEMELE